MGDFCSSVISEAALETLASHIHHPQLRRLDVKVQRSAAHNRLALQHYLSFRED
jgi:hypothetical protein